MTTGSGDEFLVVSRRIDLPYRSRTLADGYAVFGGGDDCVLVHPSVQGNLVRSAARAYPDETGGLLVGRILRDDQGPYVIVVGSVTASPDDGGPGTFRLSPAKTTVLRDQASRLYPGTDVIGWWHTHTSWSAYSPVDRENQRLWSDQRHVGLLVFARAGASEWARLYLGPESREIPLVQDAAPNVEAPQEPHARDEFRVVRMRRRSTLSALTRMPSPLLVIVLALLAVSFAAVTASILSPRMKQEGDNPKGEFPSVVPKVAASSAAPASPDAPRRRRPE